MYSLYIFLEVKFKKLLSNLFSISGIRSRPYVTIHRLICYISFLSRTFRNDDIPYQVLIFCPSLDANVSCCSKSHTNYEAHGKGYH